MLIGGTGTGKTHTAVAIARGCIRRGSRGRFFNVVDLVNRLKAEARTGRQGRLADHLSRLDFVIFDELGNLPFAQAGGQLLFHLEAVAAWPDAVRTGVARAVAKTTAAQRGFAQGDDTICAQQLRSEGLEIIELAEAERDVFDHATRAEVDVTRRAFDDELLALFLSDLNRALQPSTTG